MLSEKGRGPVEQGSGASDKPQSRSGTCAFCGSFPAILIASISIPFGLGFEMSQRCSLP
jgi:hypothetical protein